MVIRLSIGGNLIVENINLFIGGFDEIGRAESLSIVYEFG